MCLQPKLIYNPFLDALKPYNCEYLINGRKYKLPYYHNVNFYTNAIRNNITTSDSRTIFDLVKNTFLCYNGAQIPVYTEIKCGKCLECLQQKRSEFCSRCLLELSDNPYPIFFTLTYPDNELADASYHEVSDWLKRCRANISNYIPNKEITFRSVTVDEYSPKGRFHHHGILFFNQNLDDVLPKLFTILREAWVGIPCLSTNHVLHRGELCNLDNYGRPIYRYGLPYARNSRKTLRNRFACDFQRAQNPIALTRYVSKYITKSTIIKVHTPRKCALGCLNIDNLRSLYETTTDNSITLNINGKLVNVNLPTSVINRIYPTLSSNIDLRKLKLNYYILCNLVKHESNISRDYSHILHIYPVHRVSPKLSGKLGYVFNLLKCVQNLIKLKKSEKEELIELIEQQITDNYVIKYEYIPLKDYVLTNLKDYPTMSYDDIHYSLECKIQKHELHLQNKPQTNDLFS